MAWKFIYTYRERCKEDLLIIDAENGLLSHPSTLEYVSPNSGILFPNLFGASSERITLYMVKNTYPKASRNVVSSIPPLPRPS